MDNETLDSNHLLHDLLAVTRNPGTTVHATPGIKVFHWLLVHVAKLCFAADMGYAYGFMLSEEISYAYHSLLDALIGHNALDQVR